MTTRSLCVLLLLNLSLLAQEPPIRVAIYQGAGASQSSDKLVAALSEKTDTFAVSRITAEQIQSGELKDIDVLVHPGGSGRRQADALGDKGRTAVRDYVRSGGGYLGVCAGAYLATNDYDWSLNLIDARVVDKRHWARGTGTVTLRLSPVGTQFFGRSESEMPIHYGQGPLLARREWDDPQLPEYESLAVYASEIAKNGAPEGVMAGTSAAVRSPYGKGRVFCFSPHPELTDGLQHLIPVAITWLAEDDPKDPVR